MRKCFNKFFRIKALGVGLLLLGTTKAFPCSSCGSGAADPVILNPMERQKFYLGLGRQSNFKDVDNQGEVRRDLGPERKNQMEIGFAQRVSENIMGSLVSGVGRNTR